MRVISAVFLLSVLAACSSSPRTETTATGYEIYPGQGAIEYAQHRPHPVMKIIKDEQDVERLSISFPKKHVWTMRVFTPSDVEMVVYENYHVDTPELSRKFENNPNGLTTFHLAEETQIPLGDFIGIPWGSKEPEPVKIFQEPGLYCFVFVDPYYRKPRPDSLSTSSVAVRFEWPVKVYDQKFRVEATWSGCRPTIFGGAWKWFEDRRK